MAFNVNTSLPAMSTANNIGMNIQIEQVPSNNFEIRGRNPISSINISRKSSMVSSRRSTPYHNRMDTNMDGNLTIEEPSTEHLELSYETEQEKALRVGMAANQQETSRPTDFNNKATPSYVQHDDDVINIQLSYDPQTPTEPELWSGSFHLISLYGSIEHFTSDSKNIKVTLNFLAKYIQNKQVNSGKVNDLNDFDGMEDAI